MIVARTARGYYFCGLARKVEHDLPRPDFLEAHMRTGPRVWHRLLYVVLPSLTAAAALSSCTASAPEPEADLLLVGGTVWTGWDEMPRAEAVAIDDMRWMEERIGERARWAYAPGLHRDRQTGLHVSLPHTPSAEA
jgi:hypothetical protein